MRTGTGLAVWVDSMGKGCAEERTLKLDVKQSPPAFRVEWHSYQREQHVQRLRGTKLPV